MKNEAPERLALACDWYNRAQSAPAPFERFTCLWLTVVALLREIAGKETAAKVDALLATFDLTDDERASLRYCLIGAYRERSILIHTARADRITPELVDGLEVGVGRLMAGVAV